VSGKHSLGFFPRPWELKMTCCIAAMASNGSIALVSDKMVGTTAIVGEPEGLLKVASINRDWWVLFAGQVSLAGDLIDRLRTMFPKGSLTLAEATQRLSKALYDKWENDTEWAYLKKNGYTSETFRDEAPQKMQEGDYEALRSLRNRYDLNAYVILAGFDPDNTPHILSCHGFNSPGQFVTQNHDMLGYWAIGSGAEGAMWMMSYKDVGPQMELDKVAYYAVEGKYYGELGQGVGECTDLIIIRAKRKALGINTRTVDKVVMPICEKLRPRRLKKKQLKKLRKLRGVKMWGI
jgi:20S proteasome alpha/beta subunit